MVYTKQPSISILYPHYAQGQASAQTVTLTSSVEQDGRQAACPREVVIFTCSVTNGGGLQWIAEPFISVTFTVSTAVGEMAEDSSGQFRVFLFSVTHSGLFGNLASNMTVNVSGTLDGTMIQCTDSAFTMMSKTLTVAGSYRS